MSVFSGTVAVDCTVVAGAGVVVFDGVVGRRAVVWLPVFADAFSVAFAAGRLELAVEAESEVAFVADADLSFVSLMSVLLPALVSFIGVVCIIVDVGAVELIVALPDATVVFSVVFAATAGVGTVVAFTAALDGLMTVVFIGVVALADAGAVV